MKTKIATILVILSIVAPLILTSSTTACFPPHKEETPLLGDLNGDGKIDMKDVGLVALAFGSYLGHPRWNPAADLDQDNIIDINDILIVLSNFGKTQAKAQFSCTLNLKSYGRWVTCLLRVPNNYDAKQIDVSSILLDNVIPVDSNAPFYIGEHCLIVKFNRAALITHIKEKLGNTACACRISHVLLTLTWKLYDGTRFWAYAKLNIIP